MKITQSILIVIVLAVLAAGIFIGVQYNGFRSQAYLYPENGGTIRIAILNPESGMVIPSGSFLPVVVLSEGEEPLLSMELWVNGQLAAVQAAPPGGVNPLNVTFTWVPPEPGEYVLQARVVDTVHTGMSELVHLTADLPEKTIIPDESDDSEGGVPVVQGGGGEGSPGTLPAPVSLPQPVSLPADDTEIPEAPPWNPSPVTWISVLYKEIPVPAAPVLLKSEIDGCDVKLFVQDKIDNELGFNLYRLDPGGSDFQRVATRDAHEITDYFFIKDEGLLPGNYQYYVTAFNLGGETPSDPLPVAVSTDSCSPPGGGSEYAALAPSALEITAAADQVYCYRSFDEQTWTRWPEAGFYTPGGAFELDNLAAIALQAGAAPELNLYLDCWAWVGGELESLGSLRLEEAFGSEPGEFTLQNEKISMELTSSLDNLIPMGGSGGEPAPIDPQMPEVFAMILYGADICKQHTPSGGENFWENLLFCTPWPGYDVGEQPFLVWWVSDRCQAGKGDACHSVDYYRSRAADTGGEAGFHVFTQFSSVYPALTTPTDLSAWAIEPPHNGCGSDVRYLNVRMYYTGGPDDPDFPYQSMQGPESNTVNTFPFCPTPSEVALDVHFDSLSIGNLDDGIGGGDDLEIYGWIAAVGSPGTGAGKTFRPWGDHGDCPDDNFENTLNSMGTLGCPETVYEKGYTFSEFQLCDSPLSSLSSCSGEYVEWNNTIPITVEGGSMIQVQVHLMDWDHQSSDDPVCNATAWVGPESIFGWMGYTGSGYMSQPDNDNASCSVNFHITPQE